jgi:hypothetical protein
MVEDYPVNTSSAQLVEEKSASGPRKVFVDDHSESSSLLATDLADDWELF